MTRRFLFALGGSLLMGIAGVANANAIPSDSDLRTELEAVKAQLAELQAAQDDQWLEQRRVEEVKTLIRDVMADADTRASLLESGATAGHNGSGFFLSSDSGDFLMEVGGMIQVRHIYSDQDDDAGADDDNEFGVEISRAKIRFDGHIASPRLGYRIQLIADPGNNMASFDEIVISYEWADGVTLWLGEDKAPFLREEMTLPQNSLAVDRSYVNEIFTVGVAQGVGVVIEGGSLMDTPMTAHVMISDGADSGDGATSVNPSTQGAAAQTTADGTVLSDGNSSKLFDHDRSDFALTARIDLKLAGSWDQMADYSAGEGEDTGTFVGVAVHWEVGETGDSAANNDFLAWTIDGSMESNGWGLSASYVEVDTDVESGLQIGDIEASGYVLQASYTLPNSSLEPFVRWEQVDLDDINDNGEQEFLTFGVNHYLNGHNAKMTYDVVWAQNEVPQSDSVLGLQQDNGDDQIVLRAQLQLVF